MNSETSIFQREKILEYFDYTYEKFNNTWISSLLFREKEILRCFNVDNINTLEINNLWSDCEEDVVEMYKNYKKEQKDVLKQNKYFGRFSKTLNQFWIVKSNFSDDRRDENRGKTCKFWEKPILIFIITNELKIPLNIIDVAKWNTVEKEFKKLKNSKEQLITKVLLK